MATSRLALACFAVVCASAACEKNGTGNVGASGGAQAGGGGGAEESGGHRDAGSIALGGAGGAVGSGGTGGASSGGAGGASSEDAGSTAAGGGGGGGTSTGGHDAASSGVKVSFVGEPTFTGNENPAVPQAGILRLTTDVEATVSVEVSGGDETWTLDLPAARSFTKPILGLKPATTYTLSLSVTAGDNTLTAGPLEWTAPPLPANFIPLQLVTSDPSRMEPGMTMFAARDGWMMAQAPILIVDEQGIVRWYFADPENRVQEDLIRLESGNLFFGRDFCNLREIDMLGNVVRAWHATQWPRTCTTSAGSVPVDVVDFHHESHVLKSGNILTLSTETRTVDDFPTSESDASAPTKSALVLGSAIVEFSPTGELVKHISLLDLLDPTRIGRDALDPQWPSQHVPAGQRPYDWDHANAVIYDEGSDAYYVSLRHQDAIVKVSRADETLVWILGTPANWVSPWKEKLLAPQGDLIWPFHQHAVELTPNGIGLYDNGNYRAAAFEPLDATTPEHSRAVIFSVDESARTVEQAWSYGPSEGADAFFSTGMGDSDWQPETGNVLITNSERVIASTTPLGDDTTYAQILEVTQDGTRVFELTTLGEEGDAYPVYRAERIPDIRR